MHGSSGRGVKLLFSKSKVRPVPSAKVHDTDVLHARFTYILLHPPKTTFLAS